MVHDLIKVSPLCPNFMFVHTTTVLHYKKYRNLRIEFKKKTITIKKQKFKTTSTISKTIHAHAFFLVNQLKNSLIHLLYLDYLLYTVLILNLLYHSFIYIYMFLVSILNNFNPSQRCYLVYS